MSRGARVWVKGSGWGVVRMGVGRGWLCRRRGGAGMWVERLRWSVRTGEGLRV